MAVRGSPAKGVGWGDWREGSNPSFSAKTVEIGQKALSSAVFCLFKIECAAAFCEGGKTV